jgi:hypothetical protein
MLDSSGRLLDAVISNDHIASPKYEFKTLEVGMKIRGPIRGPISGQHMLSIGAKSCGRATQQARADSTGS